MKNGGEGNYISHDIPNIISPSYHHETSVTYYSIVVSAGPMNNDHDSGNDNEQYQQHRQQPIDVSLSVTLS